MRRIRAALLVGLTLLAPGLSTFTAWMMTLGLSGPTYPVALVAVFVLLATGVGVVAGSRLRGPSAVLASVSAAAGISTACYVDWSDDSTGLFMVGWVMVTVGAIFAAFVIILGTVSIRISNSSSNGG